MAPLLTPFAVVESCGTQPRFYPVSGSAAVRRTIATKSRHIRWLSANSSQKAAAGYVIPLDGVSSNLAQSWGFAVSRGNTMLSMVSGAFPSSLLLTKT